MAADAEAYDANAEAPRATTDHSPRGCCLVLLPPPGCSSQVLHAMLDALHELYTQARGR